MPTIINALAAAAVLSAVPAWAETRPGIPAPAASSAASPVVAIKDKRYCVVETFTGSRLPTKVCKTRAKWMSEDNFDPLARR